MIKKVLYLPFFIKLLHWEYWPFHIVYAPIYIYWILLAVRARSFFFFSTSNPTIKNGGFLLESKMEIYNLMPKGIYPATIFVRAKTGFSDVLWKMNTNGIHYPIIAKPDIGMQGKAVKKIENDNELLAYLEKSEVDFLVQEYIPYENEVGIFYYRYPGELKGTISGIVRKEFLTVYGDGESTIESLLMSDKRFILQLKKLRRSEGKNLSRIPVKGEKHVLVPYGNHVRGAKFLDVSHCIDDELTEAIDNACRQISGFYFGRLDIRYKSWEELKQGKCFSIIELNGAGSEPTHMYDPKHSVFFAWKEIIRHLNILWRISRINHREKKLAYMTFTSGVAMFRENSRYLKLLQSN